MTKPATENTWFIDSFQNAQHFVHVLENIFDPFGMNKSAIHTQLAWLCHPAQLAESNARLAQKLFNLQQYAARRCLGVKGPEVESPHPEDTRFVEAEWSDTASFDIAKQWYLILTHHLQDMVYETPGQSARTTRQAAFWSRNWLNALAPSNFFWSNPVAMRRAAETNGESLRLGWQNFLEDARQGAVRMSSTDEFKVGENLGTTPGKVVFRNALFELIHYTPTVKAVHQVPVVIVPPCINKFYVLDLTPKKSMIRYLLEQGLDTYIISWRNPGADQSGTTFDQYLQDGLDQAFRVACALSGQPQVNAVGYCIGGAMLATWLAWSSQHYTNGDNPVASATFFATLVDYHSPGDIEVFIDPATLDWLDGKMAETGYLDGKDMAMSFRMLRPNSLIWHYVVHGWLYGEKPSAFDVLYWNMDTTRMPATMHSWYLRQFYQHNNLIKPNALTVAGHPINLENISQPVYAVAAEDDHIAPWKQSFRLNHFLSGDKRFVLSTSGHILGIVNPPVNPPKRAFWVAPAERHQSPEHWKQAAEHHQGSWWDDWMQWLKPRSGALGKAPSVSSRQYPALGDAPGSYVLES